MVNIGIKYMLISAFSFALMGAFTKILVDDGIPSIEIVFFRNLMGFTILMFVMHKYIPQIIGKKFGLLVFRGLIGFIALMLIFYNIAHITLVNAITFSLTAPIFTVIFSHFFMGEKASLKVWIAVFIGFIGVACIMHIDSSNLSKYDMLGILSGALSSIAYLSVKELNKYYHTRIIVFSFFTMGLIGSSIFLIIGHFYVNPSLDFMLAKFVMPVSYGWLWILLMGATSYIGQTYLTKAYGATKAGIVGAVSYSNIVFSALFGISLGDAYPDIIGIFGIIMIVVSGIIVAKEKDDSNRRTLRH